eukprot:1636702-Amphidinium_carterae.1
MLLAIEWLASGKWWALTSTQFVLRMRGWKVPPMMPSSPMASYVQPMMPSSPMASYVQPVMPTSPMASYAPPLVTSPMASYVQPTMGAQSALQTSTCTPHPQKKMMTPLLMLVNQLLCPNAPCSLPRAPSLQMFRVAKGIVAPDLVSSKFNIPKVLKKQ